MELKAGPELTGDLFERFSEILLMHYRRRYGLSEDELRSILERDEDLQEDLEELVDMSLEIVQQLLSEGIGLVF